MRATALVIASLSLFSGVGCGAMLSGTRQNMRLALVPPGAEVSVYRLNGEPIAGPSVSPGSLRVHRPPWGQLYLVRASKEGYCPLYWVTSIGRGAKGAEPRLTT